jgi:single-strand DNA-binding protein
MNQGGNVTLVGFVATEPKVRYVSGGVPVAHMRVGSGSRWLDRQTGEWKDGETHFYSVSCWRSLASNSATCLRKGQPVIVAGKLRVSNWKDRGGTQRSEVEVQADSIGFDLSRGVAQFSRLKRSPDDDLNFGEAIRSGLAEEPLPGLPGLDGPDGLDSPDGPGEGDADQDSGMFDEHAIAELDQELDASVAEPAAK